MAISIINQSDNVYNDPGTTFSLTHTVGAGSQTLLLVLVGYENEDFETINSVVWDPTGHNESLTEINSWETADDAFVAAYYLIAPSTGTGLSITVTLNAGLTGAGSSIVAYTLGGVDQSTPIRDENGDAQQSPSTLSAAVTGLTAGDFLAVHANQEDTGQTMDYDSSTFTVTLTQDNVDSGTAPTFHSGYGTADAASETAQVDSTISEHMALQIVAIAPAESSSSSSSSISSSSSSSSSSVSSSISSSSAIPGTVVWGHDTGTIEDFIRDFGGNWTTTEWSISGAGDDEVLYVPDPPACGQITTSEEWYLGAFEALLLHDQYQSGGPGLYAVYQFRTATTKAGLSGATWTNYNGISFTCLGWCQVRIIHT